MILIGLAAIVGFALLLHRHIRLPVAVSPAIAASLTLAVMYAAALTGQLRPATQALLAAGLACLAVEVIAAVRKRSSALFQPSLVVPLLFLLAVFWRFHDATFVAWDDFSHWAMASREMLALHKLPEAATPLQVRWYPPGSSLFHYFMLSAAQPTEGNIIAAHAALLILPLACLFHGLAWRQLPLALFLVVGIYFVLNVLGLGFQTAMTDHVLSVLCAAAVVCYLILQHAGRSVVWVLPILFVLPLVKELGLVLAVMLGLTMLVDFALVQRERRQKILRPATIVALAVLATPLAAVASWHGYTQAAGIGAPPRGPALEKLWREWSPSASEQSRATRHNFFEALRKRPTSQTDTGDIIAARVFPDAAQRYSVRTWGVVLAVLVAAPLLCGTRLMGRTRVAALGGMGILAFCGYAAALLAAYTAYFSSYEGVPVLYVERYLNSHLAAAILVALFLLSTTTVPRWLPRGTFAVLAVACLFVLQTPSWAALWPPPVDPFRKEMAPLVSRVVAVVPPDKRVAVIYQNSQGGEALRLQFDLAPRTPAMESNIGRPAYPGDLWTVYLTLDEFMSRLRNIDYLFLARADANFWDNYGEAFAVEDRYSDCYLYRVEQKAGHVHLVAEVGPDGRKLIHPRPSRAPRPANSAGGQ